MLFYLLLPYLQFCIRQPCFLLHIYFFLLCNNYTFLLFLATDKTNMVWMIPCLISYQLLNREAERSKCNVPSCGQPANIINLMEYNSMNKGEQLNNKVQVTSDLLQKKSAAIIAQKYPVFSPNRYITKNIFFS